MNKPVRVVLADDHNIVRAGIRALLSHFEDVQIVAEAQDGREAIQHVKDFAPNLVLMDISMSRLNGLEATSHIVKTYPHVRIIILSMHSSEEYVLQALRAGASGYLLKEAATEELRLAITSVTRGEVYLSPAISRKVIDDYLIRIGNQESPLEQLTSRQREILQLIAEGKSNKEIAHVLSISVKTVETHRTKLMDRLNITDVAGLVRFAIRTGLITTEA